MARWDEVRLVGAEDVVSRDGDATCAGDVAMFGDMDTTRWDEGRIRNTRGAAVGDKGVSAWDEVLRRAEGEAMLGNVGTASGDEERAAAAGVGHGSLGCAALRATLRAWLRSTR
jgi:hypothetical protein